MESPPDQMPYTNLANNSLTVLGPRKYSTLTIILVILFLL